MSTITTGNLNLTKPEASDVMRNTIGVDLPGNFDKIDSSYTELKSRVEQIISTPVESVNAQEIIDARGGNTVLNGRFVNIESEIDLLSDVNEIIVENNGYGILTGGTVTQSITPGMSVLVNILNAHLYSGIKVVTSEATTVAIDVADLSNPRKDLIYINTNGIISYIAGTPATTPVIPSTPVNSIPLAEINVLANATSILNTNIVDIRKIINTNDSLLSKINDVNFKLPNANVLVNSDFRINQRSVSGTVTLASNVYGHDRWKAGASGCTYTFTSVNGVININITAGSLIQTVDVINLKQGTYTLSWSGTSTGRIDTGSFHSSSTSKTIAGDSNLNVEFGIGTLANVKLEYGTVATSYVSNMYNYELLNCRRYYKPLRFQPRNIAYQYWADYVLFAFDFDQMRVIPSVVNVDIGDAVIVSNTAVTQTGFTLTSLTVKSDSSIWRASKVAHGLTFATIQRNSSTAIAYLDAEIY